MKERKPLKHSERQANAAWRQYIAGGRRDVELRNRLIEAEMPCVKKYAYRMAERFRWRTSMEELLGAAVVGMIDAARLYDPDRGFKFWTFASRRVNGAMFDYVRQQDDRCRNLRSISQRYQALVEKRTVAGEKPPTIEAAAEELGIRVGRLRQALLSMHCFGDMQFDGESEEVRAENNLDALSHIPWNHLEDEDSLRDICRSLNGDEYTIVHLRYVRGATMKDIGVALGVAESRVSQMHATLITKIRRSIEGASRVSR